MDQLFCPVSAADLSANIVVSDALSGLSLGFASSRGEGVTPVLAQACASAPS